MTQRRQFVGQIQKPGQRPSDTRILGDFVGSGGVVDAFRGVLSQTVSANSTAINFQGQSGRIMTTRLAAGSDYTGCTLAISSSDFSQPPNDGDILSIIYGGSNSVEIVNSTTADISGGSITLGQGANNYTGITLEWTNVAGVWTEVGRSSANPSSAYTPSNVTTDRTYDADSTSTEELADVLGTLIADLQAQGILQ